MKTKPRITIKQLENQADEINRLTGNMLTPWQHPDAGKPPTANIGNYHIYQAYGGVQLHQIINENGGTRTISNNGCGTKRQLYDFMSAFISGLERA